MLRVGAILGLVAPFKGAKLVAAHRLWVRLALQGVLNLALLVFCIWGLSRFIRVEVSMTGTEAAWWSGFAVWGFAALVGLGGFIVLQPALNGAWNAHLSAHVEAAVTGQPLTGRLGVVGRGFVQGLVRMVLFAAAVLVLAGDYFLLRKLSGWSAWVLAVLGALVLLAVLAYEGFDHVQARRGTPFVARWRFLATHPGLALGFGIGLTLLYLIPLALAVAPAFAAAGATFAYLETERRRAARHPAPVAGPTTTSERKP